MKAWEWWVPYFTAFIGVAVTWMLGRRSQSFKELEIVKNEYKERLAKVEAQQALNTEQIKELADKERNCQQVVSGLNFKVQHLERSNQELLNILKRNEKN